MRTYAGFAVCILIALGCSCTRDAAGQALPISWSNPPAQQTAGVLHRTFLSSAVGTQVGYSIVLPPGYESSSRRYPVLYWLHGAGNNESGPPTSIVPPVALTAMRSGQLPEFIIVFVNAGGDTFYADSPDRHVPSETAFIRELIPHVDAAYRTLPDRATRAIEGFSMGGFGALTLSFKHPELFGSVVAYAPALVEVQPNADGVLTLGRVGGTHEGGSQRSPEAIATTLVTFREMFGGDPAVFTTHSPFRIVSQKAARLREMLPVRTVVGTADGLLNANEQFHDILVSNAYYHEYFVVKDIAHNLARLYERLGLDGLLFHARAGGWR